MFKLARFSGSFWSSIEVQKRGTGRASSKANEANRPPRTEKAAFRTWTTTSSRSRLAV